MRTSFHHAWRAVTPRVGFHRLPLVGWLLFMTAGTLTANARPISYSREIRPILSENCFYCHGQDANHRKAKLRLDTREGQLEARESIIPGKSEVSGLVQRVFSSDVDEQMPPANSNRHLSDAQKGLLKRWVAEGATFEGHWAFTAPVRPEVPAVPNGLSKSANPLDAFVAARVAEEGMSPAPPASRETLIRRVTFDLIGLPPTPAEIDAFLADSSPEAYEKVVDRLLANPHYGERMALPWLDAARYADSNGFQQDGDTFQWLWRDWLVKSLNANMPFDQFTIEQLAGDLLPNPTIDQKIATAFNRNHLLNGEGGAIPEEQRHVILFDRVDVTATNWLGLTMACSQCHDHKYDPITQKDYYSLLACFNNVPETGTAPGSSSRIRVADPTLDVATPAQKQKLAEYQKHFNDVQGRLKKLQSDWEKQIVADESFPDKRLRALAGTTDAQAKGQRDKELKKYFEEKVLPGVDKKIAGELKTAEKALNDFKANDFPRVMIMSDAKPRETFILDRGSYEVKKEKVSFSTPGFLPPLPKDAPQNRLGLARWLVSPEQPLTSRVAVNRMWQTFFGVGLVKTSEDFGVQSEVPIYQDLLDWLAVDFRENGWDMKRLNRLIVTSRTYRQTSTLTPAQLLADPENRLLARGPRFRLHAMFLRDLALCSSGLLEDGIGGKPVYPYQPDGIWETLAITKERDFTYPMSSGADLYRRSLYTFWRRTVGPANMFDAANRQTCRVRPSNTNTPLQALTTLNDLTWVEAARVLAEKTMGVSTDVDARLSWVYRKILARSPRENELPILRRMLEKQQAIYRADPAAAKKLISSGHAARDDSIDAIEHAAWTSVCLAVFNLDEALTRE